MLSANVTSKTTNWHSIDWKRSNTIVRNLRQRIFRATDEGDLKKVRSLQKLLLRSHSNRLLSVRRVTQDNKGKNTPGVDKLIVKTPAARARLVDELSTLAPWQVKPVKRIYIPKKATGKFRPLGIPTILDRGLQAVVKNALEPYWEAKFESSSYGFRPGRGCHDAIERIFGLARIGSKRPWVYDADIRGAFDHVNWSYLLKTIGNFPSRELIKQWLKAGYMEYGELHKTTNGTPQGGVLSPLLLNIALHGMEEALEVKFHSQGFPISERAVVRYADDFVVFCESKETAEKAVKILQTWLAERGLEISTEKSRIAQLTEGFNFLGFNIRRYKVPSARAGWKLFIKPSKEAIGRSKEKLRETWKSLKGQNAQTVIRALNPIIRGQANYYRIAVASQTFGKLDHFLYERQSQWVKHSHPRHSTNWRHHKYWGKFHPNRQEHWVFGDKQTGYYMLRYGWFPIERHVLVKGKASPDDPRLKEYWEKRFLQGCKNLEPRKKRLAQRQNGLCTICHSPLLNEEELQIDHIIPKSKGGNVTDIQNLQLVHYFCHQNKTYKKQIVGS